MSPVLNYTLPAIGVCRNFPRALVFSPTKYAGIGIKHIYTLQEIARLKDIVNHTYTNTTSGQLYRTSLEYLILELGMGTDISAIDYAKYNHLATNSLIKSTWKFLNENHITLTHDMSIPHNTVDDKPLMVEVCRFNPTMEEIKAINQCRLYLQAYHVSDIATASGLRLSSHAWEGQRRNLGNTSRCIWPEQGMPSKKSWEVWRRYLKTAIVTRGRYLKEPVGPWLCLDSDIWPWFYNPMMDGLIQIIGNENHFFPRKTPIKRHNCFSTDSYRFSTLPKLLLKALVQWSRNNLLWLIDTGEFDDSATASQSLRCYEPYAASLPRNTWCFDYLDIPTDLEPLLQDIRQGTTILISDGSYNPLHRRGTAAWVLEGTTSLAQISGRVITPGRDSEISAYRSELSGMLAAITVINALAKHHNIFAKVKLRCNCKKGLKKAFDTVYPTLTDKSNDLLKVIHHEVHNGNIQ
jgi:hypothetical protein